MAYQNDELREVKERDWYAGELDLELKKDEPNLDIISAALFKLSESKVLLPIGPGGYDDVFEELFENLTHEVAHRRKILGIQNGVSFGRETYTALLEFAILEGLRHGIEPQSMITACFCWWNCQVDTAPTADKNFRLFERQGPDLATNMVDAIFEQAQVCDIALN